MQERTSNLKIEKKKRRRTERGRKYQALAEGYRLLRSPIAASLEAAAEHYEQADESQTRRSGAKRSGSNEGLLARGRGAPQK
jgi:hypothetical protein